MVGGGCANTNTCIRNSYSFSTTCSKTNICRANSKRSICIAGCIYCLESRYTSYLSNISLINNSLICAHSHVKAYISISCEYAVCSLYCTIECSIACIRHINSKSSYYCRIRTTIDSFEYYIFISLCCLN